MSEEPGKYESGATKPAEEFKCAHCFTVLSPEVMLVMTISNFHDGQDDHYSVMLCNNCVNKVLTKVFRLPEKKKKVKNGRKGVSG